MKKIMKDNTHLFDIFRNFVIIILLNYIGADEKSVTKYLY
mgnify:CR=1 FL=1